jgi:hypothetical protein
MLKEDIGATAVQIPNCSPPPYSTKLAFIKNKNARFYVRLTQLTKILVHPIIPPQSLEDEFSAFKASVQYDLTQLRSEVDVLKREFAVATQVIKDLVHPIMLREAVHRARMCMIVKYIDVAAPTVNSWKLIKDNKDKIPFKYSNVADALLYMQQSAVLAKGNDAAHKLDITHFNQALNALPNGREKDMMETIANFIKLENLYG